ncbi:MAG TPA: biopolymer transporter ExbD [Casimicrobiaceae bacterium]|nr:biopolymer transporter ExbD [Casimicrobiaceae bacterium]
MRRRQPVSQINVVPYIDVMLVLLVIFMITAPLVAPGEIQLPSVGSKLTQPQDPIFVNLEKDKSISVEDKQNKRKVNVSLDTVASQVQILVGAGERPVVISADKGAQYDNVIAILDRLQVAGIKRVGLLARPTS